MAVEIRDNGQLYLESVAEWRRAVAEARRVTEEQQRQAGRWLDAGLPADPAAVTRPPGPD